eukprot:COSAG02_NODE_54714_length_294_cov_1.317949_2_plen_38_part_01
MRWKTGAWMPQHTWFLPQPVTPRRTRHSKATDSHGQDR